MGAFFMSMSPKVILFGLMGLMACQSETEKKSDQAVADTLKNQIMTELYEAPVGQAYCQFTDEELAARTKEKRFTGTNVAVIGVDSNGICHICTSLRHEISEIAFYPDKPKPSLPLVTVKTTKPVDDYINAASGLGVIQTGVKKNCVVPKQYRSGFYPLRSLR
jgi:hypothetical protein